MKYLADVVSLIILAKILIWNKIAFPASNLQNFAELVENEPMKKYSLQILFIFIFKCRLITNYRNGGVKQLHLLNEIRFLSYTKDIFLHALRSCVNLHNWSFCHDSLGYLKNNFKVTQYLHKIWGTLKTLEKSYFVHSFCYKVFGSNWDL